MKDAIIVGDMFMLDDACITVKDIYIYYGMGEPTVNVIFYNHRLCEMGNVTAAEFVKQLREHGALPTKSEGESA